MKESDHAVRNPATEGPENRPRDAGRPDQRKTSGDTVPLSSDPGDSNIQDYDSLGATRISAEPIDSAVDEALAERSRTEQSRSGGSSRRSRAQLGDFQLVKKLGQGAMATVYKARQISFDRKVALKILHKHIVENPKLVERFYREARILGQLDHPNIVQGYGVGQIDGLHYCAMEYVSGLSLQSILDRLHHLAVGDAVHICLRCAAALGYAHQHGLVHRDIKPENVLITRAGEVKVADLGMVKAQDEDLSLTQTGHAVGTPWYMPLEQAKNAKDVDGRSDIYALGCMFYCMLTSNPPFRGGSIVDIIRAKERGTFVPAREFNDEIPERLDLIIIKMTAKNRKYRYQTCEEVIRDLEELGLASNRLTFLARSHAESRASDTIPEKSPLPFGRSMEENNAWYVAEKTYTGETVLQKYSSEQVIDMLESGELSPTAKAGRSEFGSFRSLATYKEFKGVALALATKTSADRQTTDYRELYKKIDEEDAQREMEKEELAKLDASIYKALRWALPAGGIIIGSIVVIALLVGFIRWLIG